jgi:hypothetical protein
MRTQTVPRPDAKKIRNSNFRLPKFLTAGMSKFEKSEEEKPNSN